MRFLKLIKFLKIFKKYQNSTGKKIQIFSQIYKNIFFNNEELVNENKKMVQKASEIGKMALLLIPLLKINNTLKKLEKKSRIFLKF